MGAEEVLRLPIKTFWMMERNVNRLRADSELRQLRLITASTNTEGVRTLSQQLATEMGSVVIASAEREEGATNRLKALGARLQS